jgi:hypothetical protein
MDAMKSWFLSVLAVVGLVLALHHMGMDVSTSLGSTLRSMEHFLNQPLI